MPQMVNWRGASGIIYAYEILEQGNTVAAVAGNYIFARREQAGFIALYIGQSNNLAERLVNHPARPCVQIRGGTHLLLKATPGGEAERCAEERDLIAAYNPPCNIQHRPDFIVR